MELIGFLVSFVCVYISPLGVDRPVCRGQRNPRELPQNDSQWVPGISLNALAFDGIDDYVIIDNYKGVTGSQERTVTAWIKTTQAGDIIA